MDAGVKKPALTFGICTQRFGRGTKSLSVDETGIGYHERAADIEFRKIGGKFPQRANAK
jgi:hypothetical protein